VSSAAAQPAGPAPLHGAALAIAAISLALGSFMQVLDSTIANVSLPTISGNLGESNETGTWVITAFAVANGVTVPLTGWLMRRFGVVTTFTASVALFTVASLLCGIAWSLPSLIFFRLLQGAVSGPMIPGSQALLIAIFPGEKRAVALAIWSMTALVGPVMGPILGGYISDHFHWGWIFLINVPVGIFTVSTLLARMRAYNTPPTKLPIDLGGLVLLVLWVGALQVVLDLGKDADNIRVDAATTLLFVGYGSGGIGVIDPQSNSKIKAFPLKAHPESFQLDNTAGEIFVNLPNVRSIAVLNKNIGELRATWPMRYGANFAMALDNERKRVLVVFRSPAKFAALDMQTGAVAGETDACGDADDLFLDAKRKHIYISCGAGFVDVLNADDPKYLRLARVPTVSGARTALFVSEMDQFLLAVRAHAAEPAAIWVYRAAP